MEFYKSTMHLITPLFRDLFNKILNTGFFPNTWRDSMIVPVYKSGATDDPSNYRGISLINVMYKIFSNIVYNRLCKWADLNNKIAESQAGFRKGYSTIDNLFTLQSMVQKYTCKPGGRFYVLYVDFQKAFDSLIIHKLITTMCKNGVRGKLFQVLKSMYSNLRGCVRINDKNVTQNFNCNIGTRQRDVASTIIFNLYMNELSTFLKSNGHRGIFITEDISDIICILFCR